VHAPFHPATSSFAASDRELIEQLKKQLNTTTQQWAVTSERLQLSELRVQLLEEKLRLERIAKYGPGSEKLTSLQLELLELEPGVSNLEVAAEGEREALPATSEKKKRKHPGPTDAACGSSARGARDRVHARTVRMCGLRTGDNGDRL
jgi:hypothetical protein